MFVFVTSLGYMSPVLKNKQSPNKNTKYKIPDQTMNREKKSGGRWIEKEF